MNVRHAKVIRIERDWAEVKMGDEGGCGRCETAGGCRSGLLTRMFGTRCERYRVQVASTVRLGDQLEIELPEGGASAAGGLAFGLPLLGLFAGAAAAQSTGAAEWLVAAAGVAGLLGGYLFALWLVRRARVQGAIRVRVRQLGTDEAGR